MLTVGEKVKNNIITSKSHLCHYCGKHLNKVNKTLNLKYSTSLITVNNVPVYECGSEHLTLARLTRVNLKKILKSAHENNLTEIDYK